MFRLPKVPVPLRVLLAEHQIQPQELAVLAVAVRLVWGTTLRLQAEPEAVVAALYQALWVERFYDLVVLEDYHYCAEGWKVRVV
jgi:hypothetical protein